MRGTHWGQGYNRPTGCSAEKVPHATFKKISKECLDCCASFVEDRCCLRNAHYSDNAQLYENFNVKLQDTEYSDTLIYTLFTILFHTPHVTPPPTTASTLLLRATQRPPQNNWTVRNTSFLHVSC